MGGIAGVSPEKKKKKKHSPPEVDEAQKTKSPPLSIHLGALAHFKGNFPVCRYHGLPEKRLIEV